ncbi:MAG: ImuA family protein [Pirellulales bacterium]
MLSLLAEKNRQKMVAQLREQVGRLEIATPTDGHDPLQFGSGCLPLDELLPGGGVRRGTLVEWLSPAAGGGAATLALLIAREACRAGGVLAVVDRRGEFYPPSAARWGIDLSRALFVRPARAADDDWAFDQALRCRGVRAVLGWPQRLDDRTFRRWQLAALAGGSVGLLLRPDSAAASPSWAEVRLLVQPLAGGLRRVNVELLRCRGGASRGNVELEIDDETCVVHLAAELASATTLPRAAGA